LRVDANWVAWSPDGTTLATPGDGFKIDLWDTATGIRRVTLEGHINGGVWAAFHPAGTLLASTGWEGRVWLWDPVFGRPWLSLTGRSDLAFTRDGRIAVSREDKLTTYQVDPALEYRTLARPSSQPLDYQRASIRCDGRILAVGTANGVALWDLARGTGLTFLPIGLAWHSMFEPSGDLLTNGSLGVWRWPIRIDLERGEFRIGPPRRLPLPGSDCTIAEDRSGRIVALANHSAVHVLTPDRKFQVGPLADCRNASVSPDGQWLVTRSHESPVSQVWQIADGAKVAELTDHGGTPISFSSDGNWEKQLRAGGYSSPDGSLSVGQDADKAIRLFEIETNRTLARLESPDLCAMQSATFSADNSLLVVTTNDGPAVHVWDLRAIRRNLSEMDLDWDALPLPDPGLSTGNVEGPASLMVDADFGPLKRPVELHNSHLEQYTVPAEELVTRYTERLRTHADDPDSLHQRGHALLRINRSEEALADFSRASSKRPSDAHLRAYRGVSLFALMRYAPALEELETAFRDDQETVRAIANLGVRLNNRAWELATGPEPQRDPAMGARLAAFSVALAPEEPTSLNTLGVALYRAGTLAAAIKTLEKSLEAGGGQFAAFDLFFLAMAHHRLGDRAEARSCFDRAIRWLAEHPELPGQYTKELAAFRAEAEAVLSGPAGELPQEVFAIPRR
jgi:WD40 repeat protein/tetratricopeptide (TPR) repeat protein